ncbi:MAG: class I SAM-dependent methyltransferase [Phycisphaerae bacterium]|nr:class I SAM-dependent methyltransferase [Phycisphaerae bacterium]
MGDSFSANDAFRVTESPWDRALSRIGLRRPQLPDDLDAPERIEHHRRIIAQRPLLRAVYEDFYGRLLAAAGPVQSGSLRVELGSGGGFIKEFADDIVTSDVFPDVGVDRVCSAQDMPFSDGTVSVFFMLAVFHHLPDVRRFLSEASRCLCDGGRLVMIEPARTPLARFVYRFLHHEPYRPKAGWSLGGNGRPMSVANTALPWIVFSRDREVLGAEFPELCLVRVEPHSPFRYLLSGGLSGRPMIPERWNGSVGRLERFLAPWNNHLGMFQTIVVEKQSRFRPAGEHPAEQERCEHVLATP